MPAPRLTLNAAYCKLLLQTVVANVCLVFTLMLPQCDNLSTKGAPMMLLVDMEAVATEPVAWFAPMSADV